MPPSKKAINYYLKKYFLSQKFTNILSNNYSVKIAYKMNVQYDQNCKLCKWKSYKQTFWQYQ